MVSLTQMHKLSALQKQGWVSIGRTDFTMETPIGGPTLMMNPRHDVIMVFADGFVAPMVPHDPRGIRLFPQWYTRAQQISDSFYGVDEDPTV